MEGKEKERVDGLFPCCNRLFLLSFILDITVVAVITTTHSIHHGDISLENSVPLAAARTNPHPHPLSPLLRLLILLLIKLLNLDLATLLKPGVLPAYDEALSFLSTHSASLRDRITTLSKDQPNLSAEEKAELAESLEIASLINDPSTLSAFQSSSPTTYDARNPAFRYLRERLWRRDSGVLSKVIERCTLMHVFPDVLRV